MFKLLQLDPAVGLERQPLFWLSIGMPALLALALAIPVWSGYSLDFSQLGYETFLSISKFPIVIFSLAIPLSVLVGKLHGARQAALQIVNTRKQIENAEAQIRNTLIQIANTEQDNKTKLYLAHFDHFCKHIDFVEGALIKRHHNLFVADIDPTPLVNKLALYKFMYRENSLRTGAHSLDQHFKIFSNNTMNLLLKSYKRFLYSQKREEFISNLEYLEGVLLQVQLKLFHCRNSQTSVFLRPTISDPSYTARFPIGINGDIDHYFEQVIFWAQLLEGVETFETADTTDSSAYGVLMTLGLPHTQKPSEMPKLVEYWDWFVMCVIVGVTLPVNPE
jgi:hypothetical protein